MKILNTFKDAASKEIAWYNSLLKDKKDGFTHFVNVVDYQNNFQRHVFKSLKDANKFISDITGNKCWNKIGKPHTINEGLKQCWS